MDLESTMNFIDREVNKARVMIEDLQAYGFEGNDSMTKDQMVKIGIEKDIITTKLQIALDALETIGEYTDSVLNTIEDDLQSKA